MIEIKYKQISSNKLIPFQVISFIEINRLSIF